jgi:hypothetical protein
MSGTYGKNDGILKPEITPLLKNDARQKDDCFNPCKRNRARFGFVAVVMLMITMMMMRMMMYAIASLYLLETSPV